MLILCHSHPKPGWLTDTASSGSIAAPCMAGLVPSVRQPITMLSKGETGDETRVRRRWCKTSTGRSHVGIGYFAPLSLCKKQRRSTPRPVPSNKHRDLERLSGLTVNVTYLALVTASSQLTAEFAAT